jgi:hypothetical protein
MPIGGQSRQLWNDETKKCRAGQKWKLVNTAIFAQAGAEQADAAGEQY